MAAQGETLCGIFKARHGHVVSYSRPLRQKAIRYESTNAENLTAHFVAIEAIIEEHNLDPSRIANLDEIGITPSRECARVSGAHAFLSSTNGGQEQMPSFKNVDRVKIMPVMFADGTFGRTLYIFKATSEVSYSVSTVRL